MATLRRAQRHRLTFDCISMAQRLSNDNRVDDDTTMGIEMLDRWYQYLTGKQSLHC